MAPAAPVSPIPGPSSAGNDVVAQERMKADLAIAEEKKAAADDIKKAQEAAKKKQEADKKKLDDI